MVIQWFPGHMTKALREMADEVKDADVVIYMLDARAPSSCFNPKFTEIISGKSTLYVLNKADLADEVKLKTWIYEHKFLDSEVILMNSTTSGAKAKVVELLRSLMKQKIERQKSRGITPNIRAMVIGVPNSGKSTFINNLAGRTKAETGDRPGVTRTKAWIKIDKYFEILDTPGTLWPSFEDEKTANNLAYIGCIKAEVLNEVEVALSLVNALKTEYPHYLESRYGTIGEDPLECIAKLRKYLVRGGGPDYERAARALLDDFRKGRIGNITL